MHRSEPGERARLLREALYAQLRRSFQECPYPVYELLNPWLMPCELGEGHTVNGLLQAVTLIYGPWDTDRPHARVTTWFELPGQEFDPGAPAALLAAPAEPIAVDLGGTEVRGSHVSLADASWLLRVDQGPAHLLAAGRGPVGPLAFVPAADLEAPIRSRFQHLGF